VILALDFLEVNENWLQSNKSSQDKHSGHVLISKEDGKMGSKRLLMSLFAFDISSMVSLDFF
jgi:hypothetical protein